MPKALAQMREEVLAYCKDKGWYDNEVPFLTAMCLLHEEAAEVGHAWRDWGLADATVGATSENPQGHYNSKPQGVGSELADVLIRLLDDDARYGLRLVEDYAKHHGKFAFFEEADFLIAVNALHGLIALASAAWEDSFPDEDHPERFQLVRVLRYVIQMAEHYGIDLQFEYERKMRHNRNREYRHGGRRA